MAPSEAANTDAAIAQDCGMIIQQDGKPQQVLAKFLNLMLNYQFGLSVVANQELNKAAMQVLTKGQHIRCTFAIQNQVIDHRQTGEALSRRGAIPLFMVLPQKMLERQQQVCDGLDNIFFCAWETAFTHTEAALQQTVAAAMDESGIGNLFHDIDNIPYADLQQRVEQRLRNLNTLPTLPEIVMRIMRLVNDPKTTTEQLEQLLCRDPSIVMKLLQVIKSPIFMAVGRKASWTLTDIIVRLGLKKVGAIAQQIKMINSLVKPEESEFDMRRFWEHSVGCAIVADRLYVKKMFQFGGNIEFNDYWIGALLHDIGKLVLGFFFWDWFDRVASQMENAEYQFRKVEAQLGDVANHERVGQLLMVNADMGESLAGAVGNHHSIGEGPSPLVCLIHMADNLCKDLGLGYMEEEKGVYDEQVLEALGIQASDLDAVRERLAEDAVEEVRNMVDQCL